MALLFRQLTICGVGLIGGSLALTARKHRLGERIVGRGRTQANLDVALARGLIDSATRDPAEAAHGAELVMLATPVLTFPATLAAMVPYLPPNAVVTDVGSVKSWVVQQLEPMLEPAMSFVGVHPVAGKEITGAAAAEESLFANRRVIVTPSARSSIEALEKIDTLWRARSPVRWPTKWWRGNGPQASVRADCAIPPVSRHHRPRCGGTSASATAKRLSARSGSIESGSTASRAR